MGLLQSDKVIFYHPCDDSAEFTQSEDWTELMPDYVSGKVGSALGAEAGDPSFGSESEFSTNTNIQYVATARLSATTFVVAYYEAAGSSQGAARVATVGGTDVTYGPVAQFASPRRIVHRRVPRRVQVRRLLPGPVGQQQQGQNRRCQRRRHLLRRRQGVSGWRIGLQRRGCHGFQCVRGVLASRLRCRAGSGQGMHRERHGYHARDI